LKKLPVDDGGGRIRPLRRFFYWHFVCAGLDEASVVTAGTVDPLPPDLVYIAYLLLLSSRFSTWTDGVRRRWNGPTLLQNIGRNDVLPLGELLAAHVSINKCVVATRPDLSPFAKTPAAKQKCFRALGSLCLLAITLVGRAKQFL
jgi:hypothetical protein